MAKKRSSVLVLRPNRRSYHAKVWYDRFLLVIIGGGDSNVLIAVIPYHIGKRNQIISQHATAACCIYSIFARWHAKRRHEIDPSNKNEERDELRARFTSWLTTMLQRARLDYQRKLKREIQTIPIDDVPEEFLITSDDSVLHSARISADFFFEEEKLADAYAKMPLMRRRILQLLFIEEMKPDEVAKQMNCSPQYVYNQRLKALKQFRKALSEGGDPDEKG